MPTEAAEARAHMVEHQLRGHGITGERVLAAMGRVPRELFFPEELRRFAYEDGAFPIGFGQTISQPFIVAMICQLLALSGDERVLDVGTGSGYQAAVLAELAADVVTIERVPELADACPRGAHRRRPRARGRARRRRLPRSSRARSLRRDRGCRGRAVGAGALYEQLAEGGRLVLPRGSRWGQDLVLVTRGPDGPVERTSIPCRFVPLVGSEGFSGD